MSKVVLCDRLNTCASFSEDDLHFRGRRSTFFILGGRGQHFRRVVLRVLQITLSGPCQVVTTLAVFGADVLCVECHFAWQAQYLGHSTLYIFFIRNSALYTLHFILHTFRSPLPTLRFTLYTVDSTTLFYTLNFALHTLDLTHPTPYTSHLQV